MTHNFTPEQIAEYREVFTLFDKEGRGYLKSDQIHTVIYSIGTGAEIHLADEIVAADTTGDYQMDFEEFLSFMWKRLSRLCPELDPEEELTQIFKDNDKDKSGLISITELRKVIMSFGDSEAEIEEMMSLAKIGSDGRVDYREFIRTIMNQ